MNITELGGDKAQRLGILFALISASLMGLLPPASRAVYAEGGNAVSVMLANTIGRGLAMAVFCLVERRSMFTTRENIRQGLIGGLFQAIAIIGVYKATEHLPGPIVIIIVFTNTLMLLFFMAWRGDIKLDGVTILTTILALCGLSLVVGFWHQSSGSHVIGILFAFSAALATVMRLYVYGRQTKERHPIVVGAETFVPAAIFLLPFMLVQTPTLPITAIGYGYLFLGSVASVIGAFAMFYSISLLGAFRYSLFMKTEPIFTSLFSILLIHEILTPQQYIGMAIVVGSLAFYQISDHRRSRTSLPSLEKGNT
jgi:drug/metabolite transporter, DME family